MLWEFLVIFINGIIKALGSVVGWFLSILPSSPFQMIENVEVSQYLSGFAWVVPINQVIVILELWLVAIGVYYLIMIILRWVKVLN